MTLNTIDLFAGCGGMTDGFAQEGHYHILGCVEWETPMCVTLVHRLKTKWGHKNAEEEVIRFDIQRTDELFGGFADDEFGSHNGLDTLVGGNKVDVIIGGPPCQAYSLAGRIRDENGMRNDYRNFLFESYIKVVSHYKPDFFVFENVVGLLSAAPTGEPITRIIHKAFGEAGYRIISNLKEALFDVADFGVPQHRRRLIILGIQEKTFGCKGNDFMEDKCDQILYDFYHNIIPSYRTKHKTVTEAIGDLPKIYPVDGEIKENGKKYSHAPINVEGYLNHVPRFHSKRDIGVFQMLAEDIKSGNMKYVSINNLKELYTEVTGKKSNIHKYYVLRENEPSNTIPAHLYKDGMRHIHPDPEQARSITVREAARLQSFDDDFEFLGAMMYQYKMVGNAVPPKFARIIAEALYKVINKYRNNQ
ncbi:MAG: DNA cytosine methyltransferase [Prevotella sp.]|nr:DNA cytosine methyltransferase [Prevotella sp.]